MAGLAALVSPGNFKARKKEPERMLADFELYVKSMKESKIGEVIWKFKDKVMKEIK